MKYNVGDKVRIKSLDWYNENKTSKGCLVCGSSHINPEMICMLGKIATISSVERNHYRIKEYGWNWTDEMIEGLVEEETKFGTASKPIEPKSNANCLTRERVDALATKIDKELPSGNQNVWELPNGYQFTDENGNVINATKIVLEKKKKEYPKTFVEVLDFWYPDRQLEDDYQRSYKKDLIKKFQDLLYARDAYWKIYGEEFNWDNALYYIYTNDYGNVIKSDDLTGRNCVLAFPDKASRDAFYENFKEEIEICKELL